MGKSAMTWLETEGRPVRDAMTAALPLPPHWIIL